MLSFVKNQDADTAHKSGKVIQQLRKLLDTNELVRRNSILMTNDILVLSEREPVYEQLFSIATSSHRYFNDSGKNFRCKVTVEANIINMDITEFETGTLLFNHQSVRGDSKIKSFEFWKFRINGYKNDHIVLTHPI